MLNKLLDKKSSLMLVVGSWGLLHQYS